MDGVVSLEPLFDVVAVGGDRVDVGYVACVTFTEQLADDGEGNAQERVFFPELILVEVVAPSAWRVAVPDEWVVMGCSFEAGAVVGDDDVIVRESEFSEGSPDAEVIDAADVSLDYRVYAELLELGIRAFSIIRSCVDIRIIVERLDEDDTISAATVQERLNEDSDTHRGRRCADVFNRRESLVQTVVRQSLQQEFLNLLPRFHPSLLVLS